MVDTYGRTMRARSLLISFAAVVSLLVGACAPEPKDASGPGCLMAVAMYRGCAVDINVDSPEKLQSTRKTALYRRTSLASAGTAPNRVVTAFCPDSAMSAALRVEDACVASIDALIPQATADAAKRRAEAGPAAAALRADARYAPARDKFHTLRIQQSVACETTGGTACKLAQQDAGGAEAAMRDLFTNYQIDLRDADAFGLW